MNNPFQYTPGDECAEAFRSLSARIAELKQSKDPEDREICKELESGKMLGVLIAEDSEGARHALYAFSGQLGKSGFYFDDFVGPVFDYLQPDGYFKLREAEISEMNRRIADYENGSYSQACHRYELARKRGEDEINSRREEYRRSKQRRDAARGSGAADDKAKEEMVRQSQYEKAELRRLRQRVAARLESLEDEYKSARSHLEAMKTTRRSESEALQEWLFSNFRLLNAHGQERTLKDIFAGTRMKIPPSGAGECCAPKLLQAAYRKGWTPISIAEYWYGAPKGGDVRRHGEHYPACRGKCLPVLTWMLQGLDIDPPLDSESIPTVGSALRVLFENEWLCVVDKPSGMLSVPGKSKSVSVQEWLQEKYGSGRAVKMVHRLDQDTSGLIVAAFGELSYKTLQKLFATRQVEKTYMAILDGNCLASSLPTSGRISLPLSPDWLDRPRQRVDFEDGKEAMTEYEILSTTEEVCRVEFHPHTGRTHQLRVHAASELGLGMPIAGDRLYGHDGGRGVPRLMLHACRIEFTFPLDGQHYTFESEIPF